MTEQELLSAFNLFECELKNVQTIERNKGINYFMATGLGSQEVKHSAFLAWLLDSGKPHGLRSHFLLKACCGKNGIYDYKTKPSKGIKPSSNSTILKSLNINSTVELNKLIDDDIRVTTEEVIVNRKSRTDIIIDIPKTQTVIVIENKINAQVGRDQLRKYENELNDSVSRYYTYKHKIYIYLTKNGDLPFNIGGQNDYNANWLVFDYEHIALTVRDIISDINKKTVVVTQPTKLKNILEDYADMLENDVLQKNAALRKECQKVLNDKQLCAAFELLNKYINTYATYDNVLNHCKEWLKNNVPDIVIYNENKKSFSCCTFNMQNYFLHNGEGNYQNGWRCLVGTSNNDDLVGFFQLYKRSSSQWSKLQDNFIKVNNINASNTTQATVQPSVNLSLTADRDLQLNDIISNLDTLLNDVFLARMMEFEKMLINI